MNRTRRQPLTLTLLSLALLGAGMGQVVHAQDASVNAAGNSSPAQAPLVDFTRRAYLNGGIGMTRIEPESPSDALTISDNTDTGGHLAIGYDISRMFSVEAYFADLGTAEVDFLGASAGSVDYRVFGASLLAYLVNSRSGLALADSDMEGLFRREGLSLYGRVGVGHMDNDAQRVTYFRDYPTHAAFGLGLEYGFSNGYAVRSELMSMDSDAQYLNVGLLKRFGDVATVEPVLPPVVMQTAEVLPAPEPVVPEGPLMFKPVVPPFVYFEFDKSDLSEEARQKLDAFAEAVQDKDFDIMIAGHTDWIAPEQYNMSLSVRRAEAVFNYLTSKGLPPDRMTTIGYGETRPVSTNHTATGRALNRRTEISIQ